MLADPQNQHLIRKIKAALEVKIRPCAMIFREQPDTPWEDFDFVLVEAYQMLISETCPSCGQYIWVCRSGSTNVRFNVNSSVCYGERALEEYKNKKLPMQERSKAKKEHGKDWGRTYFVEALPVDEDEPMPTRKEYYENLV